MQEEAKQPVYREVKIQKTTSSTSLKSTSSKRRKSSSNLIDKKITKPEPKKRGRKIKPQMLPPQKGDSEGEEEYAIPRVQPGRKITEDEIDDLF